MAIQGAKMSDEMSEPDPAIIREQNDEFRQSVLAGLPSSVRGKVYITPGIEALEKEIELVLARISIFSDFTTDNDPKLEHDFGSIQHLGNTVYFKIDYYNGDYSGGSSDPTDLDITRRVLTVMLEHEY